MKNLLTCQITASVAVILVTFAGGDGVVFGQKVQALSLPKKVSTVKPSSNLKPSSSFDIAQAFSRNTELKLRYSSAAGVIHESVLRIKGDSGVMTTRFFDLIKGRTTVVQQTMKLKQSPEGLLILGSNPVYPGTNIPYPGYSPDNFLFQITPDGEPRFVTCDLKRQCSEVTILR